LIKILIINILFIA